ncbi:MAG TPA: Stp1/IreP family PP2C-type Ser/Thr phosphatase [Solirubrobacteraceae bacterium]|nr:Stp1/IreP family PP2C-type Ser/Thr phosphatase [Solirubrobacteraceae bacterium]
MLRVSAYSQRTDTGRQRRANEDAHFARAPLFAIADGMGGAQAGEVASGIAIEVLAAGISPGPDSAEELLVARIREANGRIHELSISDRDHAGMGTTATAAYVGPDEVSIVHVGDSRAYLLRDGVLQRLTQDHSLVEEFVRQGKLTPEEAEEHPQRSIITRALGAEPDVEVDRVNIGGRAGDVFLLCSDGLTSMISETLIAELITASATLDDAARVLVDAANEAGGRDNITVVLFALEDVAAAAETVDPTETAELTLAGSSALSAEEVRAALAAEPEPPPSLARVEAMRDEQPGGGRRLAPRLPAKTKQRRRRRWIGPLVITTIIAVPVLSGAYLASQAVYFLGSTPDGSVAVFKGLPYRMPLGINLYTTEYTTGLTVDQMPAGRRELVVDHKLRSHDDARDLAKQLELGQLTPR